MKHILLRSGEYMIIDVNGTLSFVIYYRGDTFRVSLSRLGEICSLLPATVSTLALTATASKTLRSEVARMLAMEMSKLSQFHLVKITSRMLLLLSQPCKNALVH